MKHKTPTREHQDPHEISDKLNKLELAYAQKKLSEKDYLMWKEVYTRVPEERSYVVERRGAIDYQLSKRRRRLGGR